LGVKLKNGLRHLKILLKTACFALGNALKENRKIVRYILVGGMTTLIDYVISFILYRLTNAHIANIAAWIGAVAFAFAANKIWVFESKTKKTGRVLTELAAFAGGRLLTLGLQELIFFIVCDWLAVPPRFVKIPASILVMVLNYFLSRFIFRTRQDNNTADAVQNDADKETWK
ncbi:MAG: GtrA family protein, partial [Pyramidobacter sp.]|nr:GtrA family protein [Pyramidobacter sp.]